MLSHQYKPQKHSPNFLELKDHVPSFPKTQGGPHLEQLTDKKHQQSCNSLFRVWTHGARKNCFGNIFILIKLAFNSPGTFTVYAPYPVSIRSNLFLFWNFQFQSKTGLAGVHTLRNFGYVQMGPVPNGSSPCSGLLRMANLQLQLFREDHYRSSSCEKRS